MSTIPLVGLFNSYIYPGFQVSESEEEGLDEIDDVDEEHENELETPVETEPHKKPPEASPAPKDTERQLSKKELKKKGLEELEAVLAELGYGAKSETSGQDDSSGNIAYMNMIMHSSSCLVIVYVSSDIFHNIVAK